MKLRFACFFALCAGLIAQTPAVSPGGILNHFSYALAGMPNAAIAQGSIFDIYGTNIGPATLTQAAGFPLPVQLASTSVQVNVAGVNSDVLLFFVASNQIVGLLPSKTPVGAGTLTVTVNGARSAAVPITVSARSIGLLTLAQNGQGPAVMQLGSDGALNSTSNSAQAGQVGVFYGTGLGAAPFDESRGAPFQDLGAPVEAFIDGRPAKLLFQGRVPGLAGLDQFNIEIPAGVTGCYVPLWLQTGGIISNLTTISVAPQAACPNPIPTSSGTGVLKVAGLRLGRTSQRLSISGAVVDLVSDSAAAAFSATDLSKVPPGVVSPLITIGSCIVGPLTQQAPGPDPGALTYLDAGQAVTVRGPLGVKTLTKSATGFGAQLGSTAFPGQVPVPPPPYLQPGVYTMDNGAGSADVGPFSVSITVPEPEFAWTNANQSSPATRAQGMLVTWSGGDTAGFVDIAGVSLAPRIQGQNTTAGGYFSCRAPASGGRFQVPAAVLLVLPASTVTGGVPSGSVTVSHTVTPVTFPLAGFEFADLVYTAATVRSIEFR